MDGESVSKLTPYTLQFIHHHENMSHLLSDPCVIAVNCDKCILIVKQGSFVVLYRSV